MNRAEGYQTKTPKRNQSRKSFLLRLNPSLHTALERWAADDLRSLNAQIEFLLAESARRVGRWPARRQAKM